MRKIFRRLQKALFREQWSILICSSDNVILRHIVPPSSVIWADPFPVEYNGNTIIFVEEQSKGKDGILGYLTIDYTNTPIHFTKILEANHHLSWPNIFSVTANGVDSWYMIPESHENGTIELYRAKRFPDLWELECVIASGISAVDPVLWHDGERWWLFASIATMDHGLNESLSLFHSETISGPWTAHPKNPVVRGLDNSRMAGKIFRDSNGDIIRPAQNCVPEYGKEVKLNRITELTLETYAETTFDVIKPENKIHAVCTHTFNRVSNFIVRDVKTRVFRLRKHRTQL